MVKSKFIFFQTKLVFTRLLLIKMFLNQILILEKV